MSLLSILIPSVMGCSVLYAHGILLFVSSGEFIAMSCVTSYGLCVIGGVQFMLRLLVMEVIAFSRQIAG